jgi:two-component system C4-dicarboxylate transport sensor histidine kinase DctB
VSTLLRGSAAFALVVAAALVGHAIATRYGLNRLHEAAQHRLDLVGAGLEGNLERFDYLPSLLDRMPSIFALLDAPGDATLRDEVNRNLQGINATAGSSTLYVLNLSGVGVAASDWNEPSNPIDVDLSFRPYVKEAIANGRGRFYAVGVTSKRAGYYLSYALYRQGRLRGIAIVKVDLEGMERVWSKLPGIVMIADERGVIILSSREEWKLRPFAPMTAQSLAEIATARPYGNAGLVPLEWTALEHLGVDADIVSLFNTRYLASARPANQDRWNLLVLDDTAPVETAARVVGMTAALAMAVLCLLGVTLWQRRRALRHKLASQADLQAAHDSLESKVTLRTAELHSAAALLRDEVETRKAIEADLRATQNELIHAGKMAVLGQMSAGMVHELNQPLGAMRTLSDNACVLLDQDRLGDVRGNLQRIAHLVDRLGRFTYQLKAFAHKTNAPGVPVSIQQAVSNAQFLVSQQLRERGVELDVQVHPLGLSALAEPVRLEQVLANLLGNAGDAMAASAVRRLRVEAGVANGCCTIKVSDTGPGIRADILPRLFEPFTTTKPAGAGLGLGLMISAHIVREFGGSLRATNLDSGGACFVIELPLAATAQGDST